MEIPAETSRPLLEVPHVLPSLRLLAAALFVPCAWPASLAVSTYFKDGFTPTAIAADAQGDVYIAGQAVIDSKAGTTGAMVAKLDGKASQYLYVTYIDSAASDSIVGITVDSSGNAYITGSTENPNFPATGGSLGTAPATTSDQRSFVAKVDSNGAILFAVLIGGSVASSAQGIAVTQQGQILVSGMTSASGFPVTQGAYSVADSNNHWFLMELDPTASKMIFSATGIGGSSIALDAAGNIYVAGSSTGTDYPTTAGAYQTAFVQGYYCYFPCQIGFPGNLQHVTKVDPTASKLIYSTGLNDPTGGAGSTTNTGLTVDSAGNAYLTGTLVEASYPFTSTPSGAYSGFLSKLDPAGANLLFSIPFGGAGVQLDASGAVYAGGTITFTSLPPLSLPGSGIAPAMPSVFSWIPPACLVNGVTATSAAYEIEVDPGTGNIVDGQWTDGSSTSAVASVLAGGKLWITGTALAPDVPITPGALMPFESLSLGPGFLQGAWLSAVDFSAGPATGPMIACVLDSGNFMHVGAVTGFQLISIFGANLGPSAGAVAPDGMDTTIAGVSATFDSNNAAQLLYVSATQINLGVPLPLPSRAVTSWPTQTAMQIEVNGATVERQFPYILNNLSVFANLQVNSCLNSGGEYEPLAFNADGSANSCTNPASSGSTVSFFLQGIGAPQLGFPPVSETGWLTATVGGCSAQVTSADLLDAYVYQVEVAMPASLASCPYVNINGLTSVYEMPVVFNYNGTPVGPFQFPTGNLPIDFAPGQPMQLMVFVAR